MNINNNPNQTGEHNDVTTTLVLDGNTILIVDIETGEIKSRLYSSSTFHNGTKSLVTKSQLDDAEFFWSSGGPKIKKATGRSPKKIHNPDWRVIFDCKTMFPSEYDMIVEGLARNTSGIRNGDRLNFNMSDVKRMLTCEWITSDLGFGSDSANKYAVIACERLMADVAWRCGKLMKSVAIHRTYAYELANAYNLKDYDS